MSHSTSAKDPARVRIHLFGHFRIERGGRSIQLPTRKAEALLAYLVLHSERHAREKLAGTFWGDSSDTEARNSLRNALATINRELGHDLVLADRQKVEINPEYPLWVDVLEFEKQASTMLADPLEDLDQVDIELYQGDLLADFYDDWVFPLREHYRSLLLDTLLYLTQQLRSRSEYERAVGFARKALAFDRANERAHQHLMFCYMSLGDRSSALRQYETCKQALWEELAVEPVSATLALYEWIKQAPAKSKPFEAHITNLPIPLSSFVGRKRETTEVKDLLASSRLLTLTGAGGSGKTRLAIQAATDLLDTLEDGVWWVELGSLMDEALVPEAIARALGVHESANRPLDETLVHFLRSKDLLLVLDNCEHLVDNAAKISESLLEACPQLKILATSREPLNVGGETVWLVPTLPVPEAEGSSPVDELMGYESIRLFVERAKAVSPGFALRDEDASFAAQICRRLDGIPLAIELAAARVKVLTPGGIAARLDDRFRLLTGGGRTAIPRHQTLRAAIDWSYDLLDGEEQACFRGLGVFSGGWTLEAAEAVCSDGIEAHKILDLLTNLVDKSMVIAERGPDGGSRFRMLETIREYSREKLHRSAEKGGIQKRHFEYFLGLAGSANPHLGFFLSDSEMGLWLGNLAPEIDNLRAALNFSLAESTHSASGLHMASNLHWFWLGRGHLAEGREWLARLLEVNRAAPNPLLAQAHLTAGFLGCWQGVFEAARADLEHSLELFEEMDDRAGVAFSLHGLGFAAYGLGDHALAGSLFDRSLEITREIEDQWLIAFTLHFTAIGTSFQGEHELARLQFEECIDLFEKGIGNAQGKAFSLFHLGRIARLQGDHALAQAHHAEGLRMFRGMGDRRGLGYSLSGFACLALAQEEIERAASLFGVVDSIREELGSLLEAILQGEYEHAKDVTRKLLGEEDFNAAWLGGYGMSLEDAVQFALAEENPD